MIKKSLIDRVANSEMYSADCDASGMDRGRGSGSEQF